MYETLNMGYSPCQLVNAGFLNHQPYLLEPTLHPRTPRIGCQSVSSRTHHQDSNQPLAICDERLHPGAHGGPQRSLKKGNICIPYLDLPDLVCKNFCRNSSKHHLSLPFCRQKFFTYRQEIQVYINLMASQPTPQK